MLKNHKGYCIFLENNKISQSLSSYCVETSKEFNWNIELFKGIDGKNIQNDIWNTLNIKPPQSKKFRGWSAMQGCFLSHFLLWKKCLELNEPLVILEHDSVIEDYFKIDEGDDFDLIKLHKRKNTRFNSDTGEWEPDAHAYLLYPKGANKLISWVENNYPYNPDIIIGSNVLSWKNLSFDLVSINKNNISTTTQT